MAALQLLLGSLLLAYGAMLLPQAAPTVPPTEPAMPAKAWHNVLEAFPTTRLRWLDEQEAAVGFHGRIAIRYNTTELRRSGDWVRLGVPVRLPRMVCADSLG